MLLRNLGFALGASINQYGIPSVVLFRKLRKVPVEKKKYLRRLVPLQSDYSDF